jgi:photosystem II stability/assembly factor-like uncharacterized protein
LFLRRIDGRYAMHWTHFPQPASTFSLTAIPADKPGNGACLAASAQGLWQYVPRRRAWEPISPQFSQVSLSAVAAHGRTWLIGSNGDIAVSRDAGATWGIATLPVKAHVLALAMSPAFDRDGLALAATARDGVLRTADHGATWHAWNYGLLDLGVNALVLSPSFDEDATCFAASDHAVFMSSNGGRAWQELGAPASAGPFTALAIAAGAPATLTCGTEGNGLWTAHEPFEAFRHSRVERQDDDDSVPRIQRPEKSGQVL